MITTTIVKEDLRKYNGFSERQLFNQAKKRIYSKFMKIDSLELMHKIEAVIDTEKQSVSKR